MKIIQLAAGHNESAFNALTKQYRPESLLRNLRFKAHVILFLRTFCAFLLSKLDADHLVDPIC